MYCEFMWGWCYVLWVYALGSLFHCGVSALLFVFVEHPVIVHWFSFSVGTMLLHRITIYVYVCLVCHVCVVSCYVGARYPPCSLCRFSPWCLSVWLTSYCLNLLEFQFVWRTVYVGVGVRRCDFVERTGFVAKWEVPAEVLRIYGCWDFSRASYLPTSSYLISVFHNSVTFLSQATF